MPYSLAPSTFCTRRFTVAAEEECGSRTSGLPMLAALRKSVELPPACCFSSCCTLHTVSPRATTARCTPFLYAPPQYHRTLHTFSRHATTTLCTPFLYTLPLHVARFFSTPASVPPHFAHRFSIRCLSTALRIASIPPTRYLSTATW